MLSRIKLVAAFAAGLIASTSASAAILYDFTWSDTQSDTVLYGNPVDIGFDINFFGVNYSDVNIWRYGSVVLSSNTHQAWLSPLHTTFSDPYDNPITYGNLVYDGRSAFAVSWIDHTHRGGARTASFQLVLVDRSNTGAGNFDFIFNFDYVQWADNYTADAYFGYTSDWTAYGYGCWNGCGPFPFDINQLPYNSINSGVAGRYVFEVRNGVVINPLPVIYTIPEPETWAMLLAGLGVVGAVTRRRRISAT